MAQTNSLVSSWNFEHITSSAVTDNNFAVYDVKNSYNGVFSCADSETRLLDIKKEDIKASRRPNPETIEASETIQTLEEDEIKISLLNKPSSVHLILENSMYQIISDDMLNLFSTINSYIFKYMEPSEKYKDGYSNLDLTRRDFFSKVVEKPDLEKYIEFYKWIDSSLGYMLEQLKPESANNFSGLKNTVESHVFERNKYKHNLPLTVSSNKAYSAGISIIKNNTFEKSTRSNSKKGQTNNEKYITSDIKNIHNNLQNIKDKNYIKNYEFIQTAGKVLNNRGQKPNDTVFQTRFSSVDGNSDIYRDETGEYSTYNNLNLHAGDLRNKYNIQQSVGIGTQGCITDAECGNFRDNNFVTRNIPWTDKNYTNAGSTDYLNIPSEEIQFRRNTNIILDNSKDSLDIVEPPVQFNIPVKENLLINGGLSPVDIFSSYSNMLDYISYRNLYKDINAAGESFYLYLKKNGYIPTDTKNTFLGFRLDNTGSFDIYRHEKLDIMYPRTDLIGLARVRTKTRYEEEKGDYRADHIGTFTYPTNDTRRKQPWSNNSYNNNSSRTRMFWDSSIAGRKKTRGIDSVSNVGSYNCFGYPSLTSTSQITNGTPYASNFNFLPTDYNPYNLLWSMDSSVNYSFYSVNNINPHINLTEQSYGDLVPYASIYHQNFFFTQQTDSSIFIRPKPFFVHNIFYHTLNDAHVINKSYQTGLDCRLKPFYDTYEDFRENIKHRSQTFSIIPEFIVGNHEDLISKPDSDPNLFEIIGGLADRGTYPKYLTINGTEKHDQINPNDFKADLKTFIDKKSNKIKIKLKGIKKLLPYNGFYPQQRTAQIAGRFMDDYMTDTGLVPDGKKINNSIIDNFVYNNRTLSVMQPLFMPGILFNSVKSGLGVGWPVRVVATQDYSLKNDLIPINFYDGDGLTPLAGYVYKSVDVGANYNNNITVKNLSNNLPFETILEPFKYFAELKSVNRASYPLASADFDLPDRNDVGSILIFLDPTHYNNQINYSLKDKIIIKTNLKNILDEWKEDKLGYLSFINNFLAETVNFFIKDSKTNSFVSKKIKEIFVTEGTTYSMDFVMEKSNIFSMFNKYSSENNNLIPPASLFGPPVTTGSAATDSTDLSKPDGYLPYTPPYFNGRIVQTVSYTAPATGMIDISHLINNLVWKPILDPSSAEAYSKRMQIKDCLNYKNRVIMDEQLYDKSTGSPIELNTNIDNTSWLIQTKFESPLINFNNCSLVTIGTLPWETIDA